jgi:uncharacterized protein ymfD
VLKYINTLSSDEVVLDYGCGKLRYTIPLSKQVKKVVAIDSLEQLSKRQIINGKMMRLLDFYDEAISIYSIDSVEWRNQQYDTIFCTNVLSAVPYYIERLQILKNAKSVLKDSGVLFISTQYRNSYFNTYNERADIQRFIDGWLIPRTNKKYCFYAPITENALSELCVDAGLQIKKVFKHDGSCFIIAAKPVDGVQW